MRTAILITLLLLIVGAWFYFNAWYINKTGKKKCWQVYADYSVLKPIMFVLFVNIIVELTNKEWTNAIIYAVACFVVGIIGQALYPNATFSEVITSNCSQEENE